MRTCPYCGSPFTDSRICRFCERAFDDRNVPHPHGLQTREQKETDERLLGGPITAPVGTAHSAPPQLGPHGARQHPPWSVGIARRLQAFPIRGADDSKTTILIMQGGNLIDRKREALSILAGIPPDAIGDDIIMRACGEISPRDFGDIFGSFYKLWACPSCGQGSPGFNCHCGGLGMHDTPSIACTDARCAHCGWRGVHPQWDSRPESII